MLPAGWTLNQGAVHQATALKRAIDVYCNFQLLISRVIGHVVLLGFHLTGNGGLGMAAAG